MRNKLDKKRKQRDQLRGCFKKWKKGLVSLFVSSATLQTTHVSHQYNGMNEINVVLIDWNLTNRLIEYNWILSNKTQTIEKNKKVNVTEGLFDK